MWTPTFAQAGAYEVTFTATDGELSDSEAITLTVTDTNRPPVATDATVTTTAGKPVAVTLSATDPDGDPLSWLRVPVVAPSSGRSRARSLPHLHAQGGLRGHRCVRLPSGGWTGGTDVANIVVNVTSKVRRVPGADGYQIALASSRDTFPAGKCPSVVVASGARWDDALAGSGLAGTLRSPVLLTAAQPTPGFWQSSGAWVPDGSTSWATARRCLTACS